MRRCCLAIVGLCVVLFCLSFVWVHSGEKKDAAASGAGPGKPQKVTDKFREEFIKNFQRMGINTTPGDAMLLRILVEARSAKRGIEVGSASGYGAINMGVGFERTGGHLYTLEISPRMAKLCRQNIKRMGLEKTVTCVQGDALKTLPKLEGEFDFMFIDAVKRDTLKYFKLVEARLKPGAVIVVDNAIQSARAMKDFLDLMGNSPDYEMVIVRASMEKRDGLAICYKIR